MNYDPYGLNSYAKGATSVGQFANKFNTAENPLSIADIFKTPDMTELLGAAPQWMGRGSYGDLEANNRARANYATSKENATTAYKNAIMEYLGGQAQELGDKADEYYNTAIGKIDDILKFNNEGISTLEEQSERDTQYLNDMRERFDPIIQETITQARDGVLDETEDQAGVRMRARATVGEEQELAEKELMRQMAQYGINTSSGDFVSSARQAKMDAAGYKALASTQAGEHERDRSADAKKFNFAARDGIMRVGQQTTNEANKALGDTSKAIASLQANKGTALKDTIGAYTAAADRYSSGASNMTQLLAAYSDANKKGSSYRVGGAMMHNAPTGIYQ